MKSTRESLWAAPPGDRPREKLQRLGPAGLSDAELVALVLGTGLPGVNVLDSAASLLAQAGGVHELMVMTVRELRALMGVGIATAGRVVAVSELWRRAYDPLPGRQIEQPGDLVDVVRAFVAMRTPPPPALMPPTVAPPTVTPPEESPPPEEPEPAGALPTPSTYIVVADSELRVRVVVSLAHGEGESIPSLVPRVLHEVLYRGGSAFALAVVEHPSALAPGGASVLGMERREELRALRDVMKLAASTVGLRYLSTVVIGPSDWDVVD
ncbi:MAG: threonyl-tRNA synthetase [Subtercola sp.]|nr:threonyl-tRNA synthetase [Subtercola sp.]